MEESNPMKILLALLLFVSLPAWAAAPISPEVMFAIQVASPNQPVTIRDKNGILRGTAVLRRVQGDCKWYSTDATRDEWKVCREGSYWRFQDPRGTAVKASVEVSQSGSSCVTIKYRTLTSPEIRGNNRGCQYGRKWEVRE